VLSVKLLSFLLLCCIASESVNRGVSSTATRLQRERSPEGWKGLRPSARAWTECGALPAGSAIWEHVSETPSQKE